MFNLKRKKPDASAPLAPPTAMQTAVQHRQSQGRGPLDHWDMFANVMATRNALPASHPSHMTLEQVAQETAREVHTATNLPMPTTVTAENLGAHTHASTGGGWYERHGALTNKPATTLSMGTHYAQNALDQITHGENTDAFRKLIRTTGHEMTHVGQRQSFDVMSTTNSPDREMEAYGSEITLHPGMPALPPVEFGKTVTKFRKERDRLGHDMTPTQQDLDQAVDQRVAIGKGVGM